MERLTTARKRGEKWENNVENPKREDRGKKGDDRGKKGLNRDTNGQSMRRKWCHGKTWEKTQK